jgi:glycine dehydrogenase subunit 1
LISAIPGFSLPIQGTFFKEFVIQCPTDPIDVNRQLLDYGIIGGLDVSDNFTNGMLFCCTELNSKEEIHSLVKALEEIGESL